MTLAVTDAANQQYPLDFMIDSGFNGETRISGLRGRSARDAVRATGGDGHQRRQQAVIVWDGQIRIVRVLAMGNQALIGTGLLTRHDLHARFMPGGEIRIEKVP